MLIFSAWNSSKGRGGKSKVWNVEYLNKAATWGKDSEDKQVSVQGETLQAPSTFSLLWEIQGPISVLCKVKISSKKGCFLFKNRPKQNANNLDCCMFYMTSVWERGEERRFHILTIAQIKALSTAQFLYWFRSYSFGPIEDHDCLKSKAEVLDMQPHLPQSVFLLSF